MSISFLSYSSPVDRISSCWENDLSKTIPMAVETSHGSCVSSNKGSMTANDSEICIERSESPANIAIAGTAQSITINDHQEVCIEFPVRDFEDFYLHNVPSPEFHPDCDAFDFRTLVTDTEALLSHFSHQAHLPSKIIEVIAAYREDHEPDPETNATTTTDTAATVLDGAIEFCLDIKTDDKLVANAAANTVVNHRMNPIPIPMGKARSAPYFVTPHISIARPMNVPSPQVAKIARFASMNIGSILSLKLSLMELVELNLIQRFMANQYGSRYLQNLIRSFDADFCLEMITVLLHHLMDTKTDLAAMSQDIYGNYLIQLFFARGNDGHHEMLLNHVLFPSLLRLCESKYGCRVVQKALGSIELGNVEKLIECFKEETTNVPRHSNSSLHHGLICCNTNHVIQKMIELKRPFKAMKFIKEALEKDLVAYSENVYACRVVQAFVRVYGDKLNVDKLFEDDAHLFLSRVKYGNYVIQCIVEKDEWYSNLPLITKFRNKLINDVFTERNVLFLSKDKHASNVIETCVKVATERQLQSLIHTVCCKQGFLLRNLISDRFGNYVPRTLLQYCSRKQQRMLVNTVHLYITNLYDYEHDYHQSAKFIQICQELKYQME